MLVDFKSQSATPTSNMYTRHVWYMDTMHVYMVRNMNILIVCIINLNELGRDLEKSINSKIAAYTLYDK